MERGWNANATTYLVGNAMGDETTLEGNSTRLKFIRTTSIITVDQTHELGSSVSVVVGGPICVGRHIPTGREDEKVG